MTIQTTSLPVLASAPGAQTQNLRANATLPNDAVNFGAALTQKIELRQIEQRQTEQRQLEQRQPQPQRQQPPQPQPNMAPPPAVAGPKPQAAAKPAANEAGAPARAAAKEAAKETARAADGADKADASAAAAATENTAATAATADEADSSADARAADSVVDMLALVASFNQAQQAAAAVVQAPVAPETVAAQPGALLDAFKGKLGDGMEPAVQPESDALLAAVTEQPQGKTEPGIDLRALESAKGTEAARLPLDSADFSTKLRDTVAQAAASQPAPAAEALSSLATQATALQTAQATGSVPTDRLSARVGTPAWDNQVGQKVIWMVGGADQSATLELNPPDLGPVQVVLNVSNDMASVTFSSSQLEVRQALENALPRLREMMNDSGIALGNATVNAGAEGRQGQDGNGSGRPGSGNRGNGADIDSAVADTAPRQRTSIIGGAGAVDTFA